MSRPCPAVVYIILWPTIFYWVETSNQDFSERGQLSFESIFFGLSKGKYCDDVCVDISSDYNSAGGFDSPVY